MSTTRHFSASPVTYRDLRIRRLEAERRVLLDWKRRSVSSSMCAVLWLAALAAGFAAGKLT